MPQELVVYKSKLLLKTSMLMFLAIVLLVITSLSWSWCKKFWFMPIKIVTIAEQLHYATPELIKAAVKEELKRGFFGLRIGVMRDNLLQVPWVSEVQVQRKWPQTVLLKISERQPLAIWENKGVIDTEGKLFFPATLTNIKDVPEFGGEQSYVNAMVDTYLWILAKIKPVGLSLKRLEIMPDHGWRAMLDNGVYIILGQVELEERLTRFVLAYGNAKAGVFNEHVQVVDLRYTNGLAVGANQ